MIVSTLHLELPSDTDLDQSVIAYHGTSVERANKIVAEQRIEPSQNGYDWLGDGAYFWEQSPLRAHEWATRKAMAGQVAIVKAQIRLGRCLDLIDTRYLGVVREAARRLEAREAAAGRALPPNQGKMARRDCAIFNYLCQILDIQIDAIRAPYAEGPPAYPGGGLYGQAHIHLCVRNPDCILGLSIFDGPLEFPVSEVPK